MVACLEFISVIILVEPTIIFSTVKSPANTISPVISKEKTAGNIASAVSAKVLLGISVIEFSVAKEPV
jgi:hypothetical protein